MRVATIILAVIIIVALVILVFVQPAAPVEQAHTNTTTPFPAPIATTLPRYASESPPPNAENEFSTDFSIHSVSYTEILSGGPPKDGIPAINRPAFSAISEAQEWLRPNEPVIRLVVNGEAWAYPLQILMWHEIVNDTIGGVPVIVTFCPLCNTAIVFERSVGGQVLDFSTTGRLRFSNLIMYDRQTESWWQQAGGNAIAGSLTGTQLKFIPAAIVSWKQFIDLHPEGKALSRQTGFNRAYGENPYVGYDDINCPPFLYTGPETPGKLPATARVLTVNVNEEAVAYPYLTLQVVRAANDLVGGTEIAVFWAPGTASALDTRTIADGEDVGTAAAFNRRLDGITLTFSFDGSKITDRETGSSWDVLGRAIVGRLSGQALEPVVAVNHFWFSWAAFKPQTRVYQP